MKRVVLASGSPRRRELLEQIGMKFEITPAHGEEIITKQEPSQVVEELSLQKALEVSEYYIEAAFNEPIYIIGADTIVAFGTKIMGKPADANEACQMLSLLQGNVHQVYTGVTIIKLEGECKKVRTFYEKTDVEMYPMTNQQILDYIETKEPMDKAGAYAIQGKCAMYIKGICGDYNNVVGLPVARLMRELDTVTNL